MFVITYKNKHNKNIYAACMTTEFWEIYSFV